MKAILVTHDGNSQRGLSLLEILASTALLSTIAWACVPLLESANRALELHTDLSRPDCSIELGRLAQAIIDDPNLVDCKGTREFVAIHTSEHVWPDRVDLDIRPPGSLGGANFRFQVLEQESASSNEPPEAGTAHAWVMVECDGVRVIRWMKLPPVETPP